MDTCWLEFVPMAVVSGLVLLAMGPTISSGMVIFDQLRAHSFALVVARPSFNGDTSWAQNEYGAKVRPQSVNPVVSD